MQSPAHGSEEVKRSPVNGYVALSYVTVHKLRLPVKSIGITGPMFTRYRIDVKFWQYGTPLISKEGRKSKPNKQSF